MKKMEKKQKRHIFVRSANLLIAQKSYFFYTFLGVMGGDINAVFCMLWPNRIGFAGLYTWGVFFR
jgi:hypothetical protein